jgi:alanine-synthesizing transaminase
MSDSPLRPSPIIANVRYEIRGRLARRAHEMERLGYDIVSLNIGNAGASASVHRRPCGSR